MPDNEEIENEELDQEEENLFLKALQEEEAIDEDIDDELMDDDDDDEDDPKVLRERLKKRNHALKKRGSALKRMQDEIKELQGSNQVTPEMLAQIMMSKREAEGGRPQGFDIDAAKERFEEDPTSIMDIMLEMLAGTENKVASVLEKRDRILLERTKKPLDPKIATIVEKMAKMEKYQGFSEEQLAVIAEDLAPSVRMKRPPAQSGGKGGGGHAPKKGGEKTMKELEDKYASELEQMGF